MIDQLNRLNQKDTESNIYRTLYAPPPLPMIPSLPSIEQKDEAPANTSVAASGENDNVDAMDEYPE